MDNSIYSIVLLSTQEIPITRLAECFAGFFVPRGLVLILHIGCGLSDFARLAEGRNGLFCPGCELLH